MSFFQRLRRHGRSTSSDNESPADCAPTSSSRLDPAARTASTPAPVVFLTEGEQRYKTLEKEIEELRTLTDLYVSLGRAKTDQQRKKLGRMWQSTAKTNEETRRLQDEEHSLRLASNDYYQIIKDAQEDMRIFEGRRSISATRFKAIKTRIDGARLLIFSSRR